MNTVLALLVVVAMGANDDRYSFDSSITPADNRYAESVPPATANQPPTITRNDSSTSPPTTSNDGSAATPPTIRDDRPTTPSPGPGAAQPGGTVHDEIEAGIQAAEPQAISSPATVRSDDTIERPSSDFGLVPVHPVKPREQSPPAADRWGNPWSEESSWPKPPQPSNQPTKPAQPTAEPVIRQNQAATQPQSPPAASPPVKTDEPISTVHETRPVQTAAKDQPPWMPLVLVGIGLAGSLAANLYLGMSYVDARRRCHELASKTADTFKQAKGAAA